MSTINIHSDYFKSSLLALKNKIDDGIARSYDYYQVCYHDDTQFINNHRINAAYRLRFNAASVDDNGVMTMLDKPVALITAELEYRESKDSTDSCASKKKSYDVILPDGTLEEQIDYAIEVFKTVITENQIPQIPLDFWRFASEGMCKWEKSYEATLKAHQLTLSAKD